MARWEFRSAVTVSASAINTGCDARPAYISLQFFVPRIQQLQRDFRIGNFIAQIVGPAAIGIDIVKMLVQAPRQQPGDHIEIFVVVRRQPTRVTARLFGADSPRGKVARNFQFNRILLCMEAAVEWRTRYGITAVFISPLRFFICSKHARQFAQRHFTVHEIAGAHFAARDGVQRFADESRRMVKSGLDGDFGIVQRRRDRISLPSPAGSRRTDSRCRLCAPSARPIPRSRRAHGFDHGIGATGRLR